MGASHKARYLASRPTAAATPFTVIGLVQGLPGVYITVAEHASNGEFTFIRWIMHATGVHGPFEFSGIDRVRTSDDGLVVENRIVCDTSAFKALAGKELPWISLA